MQRVRPPEIVDIRRLRKLREAIDEKIVGQERARDEIIDGFAIAMAGLNPPNRPISTLLFLGPTGVGKTEIAKTVGRHFYDFFAKQIQQHEAWVRQNAGENKGLQNFKMDPLVRIDCGTFAGSMAHGVIKLLGAPPSFVRSEQLPLLSPLQFPNGIIRVLLLDEIEKAFIDTRDGGAELGGILMSLLDEARIQNNRGEEVGFQWTIIIATSNFGAREILMTAKQPPIGFRAENRSTLASESSAAGQMTPELVERLNERIYQDIKNALQDPRRSPFKPELLNRFDRVVVFRFLTPKEYAAILDKEISTINNWLAKRSGAMLRFTSQAKQWILAHGIDFEYGVRSLERFIRHKITDGLSRCVAGGEVRPGDVIEIRWQGGEELEFWKDSKPSSSDASLALPTE